MSKFPHDRESRRVHIREACDNAVENGHDVIAWELEELVGDLMCYDYVAENMDETELMEIVSEWQAEHRHQQRTP